MRPEDFSNPNSSNHPEVSGATLEMQLPEQVTLRHLLHEITNKTSDGIDYGNGTTGADLRYPDPQTGAASVMRIEKGTNRSDPRRVGLIHHREKVGDSGDQVITNYFILDTPDGLQMEKHNQTSNPNKMLSDRATPEEDLLATLSGLAKSAELQKAHAIEDELGLSFVSEQEARDLLGFLDQLEPFERRT